MKHTPGPWRFFKGEDCIGVTPDDARSNDICYVVDEVSDRDSDEAQANARLIAAAPEMLEALNEVLKVFSERTVAQRVALKKAIDAVGKAIGRDPVAEKPAAFGPPVISHGKARRIASQWHGGIWSALYSLSSSGAITQKTLDEIDVCLRQCVEQQQAGFARKTQHSELMQLRRYCVRNLHREPVDKWGDIKFDR